MRLSLLAQSSLLRVLTLPYSLAYSVQDMTSKFPTEMKGQDSGMTYQNFWEISKSSWVVNYSTFSTLLHVI